LSGKKHASIISIEYVIPEKRLTNEMLTNSFPEWSIDKIVEKTGICSRGIASQNECASDLGVRAAEKLFESGACSRQDIDYLLFCTQSPDYFLPTTACLMQERLGLTEASGAIDFNLGCSGYVYGLGLAKGLIETGQASNILLVTAETYSKYIHPADKSVRTLFGDAGTATYLTSVEGSHEFLGPFVYGTDGKGAKNLIVPGGALRNPIGRVNPRVSTDNSGNQRSFENLYMNGSEILTFSLIAVPNLLDDIYSKAALKAEQVDLYVFHQANKFMLNALQRKCNIPKEKFFNSYEKIGNTVSCTIPIALKEAQKTGVLRSGMTVLLVGFGVGYSWGANILRWSI
jgi:3-oxoacyl-[acyl-carrier-protein] synthase-3